jgi:hypothetical protein
MIDRNCCCSAEVGAVVALLQAVPEATPGAAEIEAIVAAISNTAASAKFNFNKVLSSTNGSLDPTSPSSGIT